MSLEVFVERSYRTETELLNPVGPKDTARYELALNLLHKYKGRKINILTLPSVWWNFEKLLFSLNREEEFNVDITIVSCEKEHALFDCTAQRIPHTGLDRAYVQPTIAWTNHITLFKDDIFNVMWNYQLKKKKFDFIWLDLMCTSKTLANSLSMGIPDVLKVRGELVVTFLRARDDIEDRTAYIESIFNDNGYKMKDSFLYNDISPMTQLTFVKNGGRKERRSKKN